MSENTNDFPKICQESLFGQALTPTWIDELEAWVHNYERQVERIANLLPLARRACDVSTDVSAMGQLLRQSHAVCKPVGPNFTEILATARARAHRTMCEALARDSGTLARFRRLLQRPVRPVVDLRAWPFAELARIRLHAPATEFQNRESNHEVERRRGVDPMVGHWYEAYGSERWSGLRATMSGTNRKDFILRHMWSVLERDNADKLPGALK